MCLAEGHNEVTPVRLEPATPRSQDKYSTTEPLGSLYIMHLEVTSMQRVTHAQLSSGVTSQTLIFVYTWSPANKKISSDYTSIQTSLSHAILTLCILMNSSICFDIINLG